MKSVAASSRLRSRRSATLLAAATLALALSVGTAPAVADAPGAHPIDAVRASVTDFDPDPARTIYLSDPLSVPLTESDSWTVPPGITTVSLTVVGASGGSSIYGSGVVGPGGRFVRAGNGGAGSQITADLAVTSGQVLTGQVGALGGDRGSGGAGYGAGGDGGGGGCPDYVVLSGGGGGSTAVLVDGDVTVVAAGGGGAGGVAVVEGDPTEGSPGAVGSADVNDAESGAEGQSVPGVMGAGISPNGGDGGSTNACFGAGGGGGGGGPVPAPQAPGEAAGPAGGGSGAGANTVSVGGAGGGGGGSYLAAALTGASLVSAGPAAQPGSAFINYLPRVDLPADLTVAAMIAAGDVYPGVLTVYGCEQVPPLSPGPPRETPLRTTVTASYTVDGVTFRVPLMMVQNTAAVALVGAATALVAQGIPADATLVIDISCEVPEFSFTIPVPSGGELGGLPPAPEPTPSSPAAIPVPVVPPAEPAATRTAVPTAAASAATLAKTGAEYSAWLGGLLLALCLAAIGGGIVAHRAHSRVR